MNKKFIYTQTGKSGKYWIENGEFKWEYDGPDKEAVESFFENLDDAEFHGAVEGDPNGGIVDGASNSPEQKFKYTTRNIRTLPVVLFVSED